VFFDPFGTHICNAGRTIFIGTFDINLGVFRIDVSLWATASTCAAHSPEGASLLPSLRAVSSLPTFGRDL
jgi:hypothetical protein